MGCTICPRACAVDRMLCGGVCGQSNEMRVARIALHAWEEPPLSGENGSGTIFFTGCSLRCAYCQNAAIALGDRGSAISAKALAQAMCDLEQQRALNINLVTPTHFAPQIRRTIAYARQCGLQLPMIWNTSGYELVSAIHENTGFVDIYLTDYKYANSMLAHDLSAASDYPEVALNAIEAMLNSVGMPVFDEYEGQIRMVRGVIVRHMVIPGELENSFAALKRVYTHFGDAVLYSIMNQYTPVISPVASITRHYPNLLRTVTHDEYERVLDCADRLGMTDYFWQDGETAKESFIPEFAEV